MLEGVARGVGSEVGTELGVLDGDDCLARCVGFVDGLGVVDRLGLVGCFSLGDGEPV